MNEQRALRHKPTSKTSKELVAVLWFFFGWMGAHRLALGSYAVGAAYGLLWVTTCGVGGFVGWVDGFILLLGTPKDALGLPVVWSWRRGKLFVDPLEEGTYEPMQSIARIVLNVGLLFFLPFAVVAGAMMLFETSQVKETIAKFATYASLVLVPLLLVQVVGTWRKARAQIAMLRAAHGLTRRTRLDAIARAASIITPRGGLVLLTGLAFLALSLRYQWADLGVIAVLALSAFYLVTSATALLSSFIVRKFSNNLLERGAVMYRQFQPGVARAGDAVKDQLDVKGVPVPPGFFLTVTGLLPPRLQMSR